MASIASRRPLRSEEHTSELQSRRELVCRLLLEKKKQHQRRHSPAQSQCTRYLLATGNREYGGSWSPIAQRHRRAARISCNRNQWRIKPLRDQMGSVNQRFGNWLDKSGQRTRLALRDSVCILYV